MRIALSNPDNIGDFILRQPMLAALHEAGHDILLVVRDFVAPIARSLFPEAVVLQCAGNPYTRDFTLESTLGRKLIEEVRQFRPELLAIASYQHTQLEESLAAALPDAECVGFNGYLFQARPEALAVSTIRFAMQVPVAVDSPELKKNELLCKAILGSNASLGAPRMEARPQALAAATALLDRAGMGETPFWAVCAGNIPGQDVRNWRQEQWAEFCRSLVERTNARLLFIGSTAEHEVTQAIREKMGRGSLRTATITDSPIDLDVLTAILQFSSGYIGKDTGPMHMAAALGKPVLAVFGGGNWPRFVPAATVGGVFTMRVPCTGCDWICHLSRSHCVKDVTVPVVLEKAETLVNGHCSDFSVEVVVPDEVLDRAILRDLLGSVRREQQKVAAERANFMQWHDDRLRDIAGLREELTGLQKLHSGVVEEVTAIRPEREQFAEQARVLAGRVTELEIESRLALANAREAEVGRMETERRSERLRQSYSRKLAEANARRRQLTGELEGIHLRLAEREAGAEEIADLRRQLEEQTSLADRLQTEIDTVESRHLGRAADLEQLLKRKTLEWESALALIPDLREELAACGADLATQESVVKELERRLDAQAIRIVEADKNRAEMIDRLAWADRELQTLAADHAARLEVIEALSAQLNEASEAAETRRQAIEVLDARIQAIEQDRAQRLHLIETLTERLAESEQDRAQRLSVIETLSAEVAECDQDRIRRLRIIEELSTRLQESEKDREARLQLIERLSSQLTEIETDRKDRGQQIEILHQHSAQLQNEIASLRNLLPYRILKQLRFL